MILFSPAKRGRRQAAERLYAVAMRAARNPALFRAYGVPDTLQGRFEMVALHLFALLHRLMLEPGDDPDLARLISETFVEDMDAAMREMGVGDVTVPKRMKALYRSFGGRISAYGQALSDGNGAVVEAVARNVFPEQDLDERAAPLARHLQATVTAIRAADLEALRRGVAPFPEPATEAVSP